VAKEQYEMAGRRVNNGATLGFEQALQQAATALEVPNWHLKMRIRN